jgi:hypothetical protein
MDQNMKRGGDPKLSEAKNKQTNKQKWKKRKKTKTKQANKQTSKKTTVKRLEKDTGFKAHLIPLIFLFNFCNKGGHSFAHTSTTWDEVYSFYCPSPLK